MFLLERFYLSAVDCHTKLEEKKNMQCDFECVYDRREMQLVQVDDKSENSKRIVNYLWDDLCIYEAA